MIENDRDGATSGRWDGRELTGQIDSLRTLADTDSALTPIGERPERVEIARAISVEQTFQVFAWVAEDHGMTLDPAPPKGREIVEKLVATADVVVANLPPQILRSLALDLESLRRT